MTHTPRARVIHLGVHVAEGGGDAFLAFLKEAKPYYEGPGGIRVRLLRSLADPRRFIEVVEYDGEESFDRDQLRVESDPEMAEWLRRWRTLLDEAVRVEVWEEVTDLVGGSEDPDRRTETSGGV